MRTAADGAPGPISALAAAIVALAAGTIRHARLSWALLAEPADPDIAGLRLRYRQALTGELEDRLRALPLEYQAGLDPRIAAAVILGALLGGLVGPSTPETSDPARERELVQLFTLFALRGIGISDSRARGIIVQTPIVVQA
jgi:AcrR family transcriptional regulator